MVRLSTPGEMTSPSVRRILLKACGELLTYPPPPCATYIRISESGLTLANDVFGFCFSEIWWPVGGAGLWQFQLPGLWRVFARCDRWNERGQKTLGSQGKLAEHSVLWLWFHAVIMAWKWFSHYWPFVRGICLWLVDSPHKWPMVQTIDVFLHASLSNLVIHWGLMTPYGDKDQGQHWLR